MDTEIQYAGRFAPSPTGPLHFGSMVAAVGSYLQARKHNGLWYVRIEDLDPPREVPGASDAILRTLERFGLHWDGPIMHQSNRTDAYIAALETLHHERLIYPCSCTRKEITQACLSGQYGPIYSGLCRSGNIKQGHPTALRVITHDREIRFKDKIQGDFSQQLFNEIGDFVVRRADKLFAYQLAVVVDDAEQKITEIVRGTDLLDNTPRQIHLQQLLKLPTVEYLHLPIAINKEGQKLSKQTGAPPVDPLHPQTLLVATFKFLGQQPPSELATYAVDEILKWGIANWDIAKIPRSNIVID